MYKTTVFQLLLVNIAFDIVLVCRDFVLNGEIRIPHTHLELTGACMMDVCPFLDFHPVWHVVFILAGI